MYPLKKYNFLKINRKDIFKGKKIMPKEREKD